MWYKSILEKGMIPDPIIRLGIRKLLKQRLEEERIQDPEQNHFKFMSLVQELRESSIAVETQAANEQHYEVPTEFYQLCLGKHLKYSSGYWKPGVKDIDHSERDMLELTIQRADLKDGQHILEMGCGWGSLSLFMAERFSKAKVTGVSNSRTQKLHIDAEAAKRGITNLTIITKDMNHFDTPERFDRIVSVEMFEHMRNYERLFSKVHHFLRPEGKLFIHIFTHKDLAYKFEVKDDSDWMSKYFFTGGIMPSDSLMLYFAKGFEILNHWRVSGKHYSKTSEAWLDNMDKNKDQVKDIFVRFYGESEARKWQVYWRIFFMACAELWGYNGGEEWMVSHYLFQKKELI